MFLDKIKSLVNAHSVISFDIFDTLLIRPYVRPADLFLHLEKLQKQPGWAKHRRQAEDAARRKYAQYEDITLDEIYEELSAADSALKAEEMALERQTLQPNPEIQQVFNYAKQQGKRIIIVSDMYLPADFLTQVLQEKGFTGFEKLYVSNAVRKLKGTGALYRHVAQELKVAPEDFLHIGDNFKSDVRRAKEAGWSAVWYPGVAHQYWAAHPREARFFKQNPCYEASVSLGVLIWAWQKARMQKEVENPYFYRLGYAVGGPVAYGFARWIEQRALNNHTPNLFFAARDGYTLQRVFDTFQNKNLHTAYIYALRFINRICRLDYYKGALDQTSAVLKHFTQVSPELKKAVGAIPSTAAECQALIQKYMPQILPLAQQEFANYQAYLKKYQKFDGKVGIVDSVTFSFSAQKLIESVFGKEQVKGYYWSVIPSQESEAYGFDSFLPPTLGIETSSVYTHRWDFMEFLFTAPEPPVKNILPDGTAVYAPQVPEEEQKRIKAYRVLSDGMLAFAQDCAQIFGGRDIFVSKGHFAVAWVNSFLSYPTAEDKREMAAIRHASDTNHAEYLPLLSYRPSAAEFWKNPKKYLRFIKRSHWKTPLQAFLVSVLSPVAATHTPGNFTLYFLPRAQRCYGKLSLRVGRRVLAVAVGRKGE